MKTPKAIVAEKKSAKPAKTASSRPKRSNVNFPSSVGWYVTGSSIQA
jgi:hypothetical protein